MLKIRHLLNMAVLVNVLFVPFNSYALPEKFTVKVPRPDGVEKGMVTLELSRYSVRDPNSFEVFLDEQSYANNKDPKGADKRNFTKQDISKLPVRTYRGKVLEQPNSSVVAVVWPGDNTLSAAIDEGKRVLWNLNDLPINIDKNDKVTTLPIVKVEQKGRKKIKPVSSLSGKSQDWIPSFNNLPTELKTISYPDDINRKSTHGWPLQPITFDGITRVQVAVDAEPEWLNKMANNSLEKGLAIIEHSVNVLDISYVRDVSMSHVLTGYIQRTDTNLHKRSSDSKTTWRENGLGINPGSRSYSPEKSIPFQQLIVAFVGGNPAAFASQSPLTGGNFSQVTLKPFDAGGMSHEISHNWGGRHFVYPRDSMSGGGPWFGPTTAQRMIFLKEDDKIGGGLPKVSNQSYNWNVHPYATPDMVRTPQDKPVLINVLANDFDGNGDVIGLASFDKKTLKGGTIKQVNNQQLLYTPPAGFTGRDTFNYNVADQSLTNDAWVQVDVGSELVLKYNFDTLGTSGEEIQDSSGSQLHGSLTNFKGLERLSQGISDKGLEFPWLMTKGKLTEDKARAFIDFDDVADPFDGDHSVSLWVKFAPQVISSELKTYLVSNSSSTKSALISGYTIYADTKAGTINFEVREQLDVDSIVDNPPLRQLTYQPENGLIAGKWYHLALVIDRKTDNMLAYVNNQSVADAVKLNPGSFIKGKPSGGKYMSAGLGINTYKPKKFGPFAGVMDEFAVYNKRLTSIDIDALFNLQPLPSTSKH